MAGPLNQYLAEDHDRLDEYFRRATARPDGIEMEPYAAFRKGLLRHIAMEEKVVLPTIARLQGGTQSPMVERIRLDHGAIVALLAPPPTQSVVGTLRSILRVHNALEEENRGLYELLDSLAGSEADGLLEKLKSTPDVRVLPHNTRPETLEATRRAVTRAGYEFMDVPTDPPSLGRRDNT